MRGLSADELAEWLAVARRGIKTETQTDTHTDVQADIETDS
nr:hypothetical protein [Mycobacterium sp.]